jgi:hypothetical protein
MSDSQSDSAYEVAQIDAIAEMVRQVSEAPAGRNRRKAQRNDYSCVQLVAPYDGVKHPPQNEFRHVVCRDLSTSGISFLLPEALLGDRFIVALGQVPFSFVVAEAVRMDPTADGEVLVGCRFIERLAPPDRS